MNGKHRQNAPTKSTTTKPAQDTSKGKTEKSIINLTNYRIRE